MTVRDGTVSDETLREMLAGLEGVTPGPRHMYVSPNDILVTDDAGNNMAQFFPMEDDAKADFCNATQFARSDTDTMRAILTDLLARRSVPSEPVAWRREYADPHYQSEVTQWKETAEVWAEDGFAVTPLYPSPASKPEVTEGMVEAAAKGLYEDDDVWNVAFHWPDLAEGQTAADTYRRLARAALTAALTAALEVTP